MDRSDSDFSTTMTIDVSLPYRKYLPKDYGTSGPGHPLLLFLHGIGECGTDLDAVSSIALPRYIEDGAELPFVTICPQCPWGQGWNPSALSMLLDKVMEEHNIDTARVYLTGLSMGGRGTWELANRIADRLAAAIPICPPFIKVNPENFKEIPIWCFHGSMDLVIPVGESVRMVKMLRDAGCSVEFTTYSNADHDSWTETYQNPAIYEWLLSHRKPQS